MFALFFFLKEEDGIGFLAVTGVRPCVLPISARDSGGGLGERGDLRPAGLSWGGRGGHRTRCSGAEGRAKLHPPMGTVKDFCGNYRWDARLGGRRWRSAAARPPGARREMVRSECDKSSPSTVRVR